MILSSITLTDFGTFGGQQRIPLRPKPNRPIVLFGGKNGVGKTTLLEAIRLCLYGQQWNGTKLSKEQYSKYLEGRIHRNPTALIQANSASVGIEFDFADKDGTHCYKVMRGWERKSSGRTEECLLVERDGRPLDEVTAEYWHEFVRDLLPLGISQLFFFDGERIQQLAEDGSDQQTLSEAIKLLLGVDLIERLNSDLSLYVSRALAETKRNGEGNNEFLDAQQQVEILGSEISDLTAKAGTVQTALDGIKGDVNSLEQQLSSSGASFAHNRDRLLAEQHRVRAELLQTEASARELCAGLLPFALLPELRGELREQLAKESECEQLAAAQQVLAIVKGQIVTAISTFKVDGKKLPSTLRSQIIEIISGIVNRTASAKVMPRLHDLSAVERRRLQSWLDEGIGEVVQTAKRYAHSLEGLHRQQTSIETQLRKIPAEDQIRPVIEKLKAKYQELAQCQHELSTFQQEIDQKRNKLADAKRKYDKAADNLSRRAASESRLHIVPKVRAALEEFKLLLILRKVRELEGSVTTSFNLLCRKKDNMRRISIDPSTFAITVIDRDGHPIPKSQLSAGEKQVYAISMLWALAKTSRRPLPIIIDTPLARLDRDHRHLLAENYFPHASHQVLMLSTDTEVDESYFETISPNISHAYLLEFSPEERFTSVRSGYFWRSRDEAYQAAGD